MNDTGREWMKGRALDDSELDVVSGGTGNNEEKEKQNFLEQFADWSIGELQETLSDLQRGDITGSRSERDALTELLAKKESGKM